MPETPPATKAIPWLNSSVIQAQYRLRVIAVNRYYLLFSRHPFSSLSHLDLAFSFRLRLTFSL